ncbi:conserved membrane hypothetical protein [Sphingomonas sp. EC-HK361]|uniref:O-antigen ligase family protein n=1 Tax=Sphingomonas sp. EC-HK361 TaxID=2038397 RepID=UPI00125316F7|nr:O-antigen ligase family protein [Sphingomonas sp. EC-HK361]VVS98474.1 conserved membrane hypothetical protein [Sphingomonas sp. EC-HK361]
MSSHSRPLPRLDVGLGFILLCAFAAVLWLAGGASRADAMGQVLVRTAAFAILVALALFGPRPAFASAKPVTWLLASAILLAMLQLVPLPPALWQALPGRALFGQAAELTGQSQPWRPIAIVPGAAANAAASLVVPLVVLILWGCLREDERRRLPGLLLILVTASMALGLLQFTGSVFDNPLINDSIDQVSGTFANRNHFAAFLAIGCVVAPVWAFAEGRKPGWRAPTALGIVALLVLALLLTGSRAGILLGVIGLGFGLLLARDGIRRTLRHYPRWVFPALIGAIVLLVAGLAVASILADRAVSVHRVFENASVADRRENALPVVLAMVKAYFPFGAGFGGFDQIFRIHEPFDLLTYTYFNQAHDDLLAVVLDGGLAGAVILLAGLGWAVLASMRAWRTGARTGARQTARLGSVILLIVVLASAVDYPARTPMMMAVVMLAALWLADQRDAAGQRPLPATRQPI